MRILTLNIRGNNGVGRARRGRLVDAIAELEPDVIALQEVAWRGGLHDDLTQRLAARGWAHAAYSGDVGSSDKHYGNLIAARWQVAAAAPSWVEDVPWPQSLLRAQVSHPDGTFDVIAAHIPNGSGNGWYKIETFEALARGIERMPVDVPLIVVGDFNEPRSVLDDGTVVPFGGREVPDGTWSFDGSRTAACGRNFPRSRWHDAVLALLGHNAAGDLRHALRDVHGPAAWHVTHEVRGRGRFFDHVLVSPHWRVLDAGFDDAVREHGISDHSAAWADVQVVRGA